MEDADIPNDPPPAKRLCTEMTKQKEDTSNELTLQDGMSEPPVSETQTGEPISSGSTGSMQVCTSQDGSKREDQAAQTTDEPQSVGDSQNSAPQKMKKSASESDVGITEFISNHQGFSGIIKQRFSDFLVNEISQDGSVVRLTDLSEPQDDTEVPSSNVLTEEQTGELAALMASSDKEGQVIIKGGEDKEIRGKIHQAVRENFPDLESSTADIDGEKVIKVTWKSAKGGRQRKAWPTGRGDYCRFVLYKENKDTMDAMNLIAKFMRLKPGAFTYGGTKDRRAKTCQHITVYRVEVASLHKLNQRLRGLAMGDFTYCKDPLKLGDLSGNHFTVVLRNVTGSEAQIEAAMSSLKSHGFINYYGMQRFGTSSVPTHHVGRALLQGKWSEAVDLILQPRGPDADDMEASRVEWTSSRDAQAALRCLPRRQSIERHLLHGLSKYNKNDLVSALTAIPRNTRLMYVHSYQSFVWNTLVSRRLREMGMKVCAGDLVLKSGASKGSVPAVVSAEDLDTYSLEDVVMPLPGHDVLYPENQVGDWYREMLNKDELGDMKNRVKDYSLPGDYRHIIVKPSSVTWHTTRYDDVTQQLVLSDYEVLQNMPKPEISLSGKFLALVLTFSLQSSCYATMAIREVLKSDTSASHQASLNVT